jgi:hypothetical protein
MTSLNTTIDFAHLSRCWRDVRPFGVTDSGGA